VLSNHFGEEPAQSVLNQAPRTGEEDDPDKQEEGYGKKRDGTKYKVADTDQHQGDEAQPDLAQHGEEPAN
jgi:hypothetical protein